MANKTGRPIGSGNIYKVIFPGDATIYCTSRKELSQTLGISEILITRAIKQRGGYWHNIKFEIVDKWEV